MLDQRERAAVVLELVGLAVALVIDGDENSAVEERELAQPLRQGVEAVFRCLENLRVGFESNLRATSLSGACDFERFDWRPTLVALLIDLAIAPDLEIEPLRQRVHHGYADAVQPARHLVRGVLELTAGVQHRE